MSRRAMPKKGYRAPRLEAEVEHRLIGLRPGAFYLVLTKHRLDESETDYQMAKRLGFPASDMSRWKTGTTPQALKVIKIAAALGIHAFDLLPPEQIDWAKTKKGKRSRQRKFSNDDLRKMDDIDTWKLNAYQQKRWDAIQEEKREEARAAANREVDAIDFKGLMESKLKIAPEAGGIIPFIFWRHQGKITQKILSNRAERRQTKIMDLKYRREGCTTECMGLGQVYIDVLPHRRGLVMSSTDDNTKNNHLMMKVFKNNWPEDELEEKPRKWTKEILEYEEPHGSSFKPLTASAETPGLGHGFQFVICDEAAFWRNATETWDAISACIPKPEVTWDVIWLVISTPNGQDELFYPLWQDAQLPGSEWITIFDSWGEDNLCRIELEPGERLEDIEGWSDEAKEYQAKNELDAEQMKWAMRVWRNECRRSWPAFHKKYPITPEYAFMGTSDACFDNGILQKMLKAAQAEENKPVFRGDIDFGAVNKITPELTELPGGRLHIWEHPVRGTNYAVCTDPSLGYRGDFCEIAVIRIDTGKIVAHFRSNTLKPRAAGIKSYLLAVYYNWALLCIESVADVTSVTICEEGFIHEIEGQDQTFNLKVPPYPALFRHRRDDKTLEDESGRKGYVLSGKRKKEIIGRLAESIPEGDFTTYSVPMLLQMMNYSTDPETGKFKMAYIDPETNRAHDDGIAVAAMAHEMALGYDKYTANVPTIKVANF